MDAKGYYLMGEAEIEKVKLLPTKPRLLMHSCCGPCNSFPIEHLSPYFQLTLYFNNHNIYPYEEFIRRYEELKRYVEVFEKENDVLIELILPNYEDKTFDKVLASRKDDREGQQRCKMCYSMRMQEAFKYAAQHDYDYMTTVMTISRQKDSVAINQIAEKLQPQFPKVKYLYSNFKKNRGMDRSVQLSKIHNMYRQTYCGCIYSFEDMKNRKGIKEE
jgi:predicted adenine nucleotide alpha hydrolase (AANH) superfamily ATPase